MPTFDFEGIDDSRFIGSALSPSSELALMYTVTDDGVPFTFSFAITPTSGGVTNVTLSIIDNPFNGVDGFWSASATVSYDMSLSISFATTPMRQAFTTGAVVDGTFAGANMSTAASIVGNKITFTTSGAAANQQFNLGFITTNFTCYCAGTRIATPDGFKEVQDLVPGDRLRLADGGETTVKWLGRQTVSKTFSDPKRANPICIGAGALGNERDLCVSPDHGIVVDGFLINASALVNGDTIYQVREMPGDFTYYHVETEAHEVILAEGIPTESYVDLPSRAVFDNGHERANAPMIQPLEMPRISSRRMLPPKVRTRDAA